MAAHNQVLRISAEQWKAQKLRGAAVVIDHHPYVVISNAFTGEPAYHRVVILESSSNAQRGWIGFREAGRDATAQGQMDQADGT